MNGNLKRGGILLLLMGMLASCTPPGPTPTATLPGESLEWEKILDGWGANADYQYGDLDPKMVITVALTETVVLSDQLHSTHLDIVQNIDFTDYFVIIIYQGEKMSTGYSIEVVDVRLEDNIITVYAEFLTPGPEELRGSMITSPYCVLRVKKSPDLRGSFTFVLIANGKEIKRQQHAIP